MPRKSCSAIKKKGRFNHCRRKSAKGRKCTPVKRGKGKKTICRVTPKKRRRSSTKKRRRPTGLIKYNKIVKKLRAQPKNKNKSIETIRKMAKVQYAKSK